MSDILSECQEQMFHVTDQMKKLKMSNSIKIKGIITMEAIRGTYVHHLIENLWREKADLPPLELRWTKAEQKAWDIYNDPENPLKKIFDHDVDSAMDNFYKWVEFYDPQDVIPEQRIQFKVPGLSYPVKGTVDFICSIAADKLDYAVSKTYGNSTERKMVVIDWKSGKSGKAMQISAYLYGLQQTILPELCKSVGLDSYTYDGKLYGGMLFLGGTSYDFKLFKYDSTKFLKKCEVFETVKRVPVNFASQRLQTSPYLCKYCTFSDRCSLISEQIVDISIE